MGNNSGIKKIGLLGGSFNPPHQGHLHISDLALKNLKLDEINNVLNLGWNAFGQNEDYIKDPIRLLTTGKIFDMKIDIKTKSYDRLFFYLHAVSEK